MQHFIGYDHGAGKGIHTADMRVEDIFQVGAVPSCLGIEVYAATGKATCLENDQQAFGQFAQVHRELIGIPSVLVIAPVGIDAAQHIIADKVLQKSPYKKFRKDRYASFDSGKGKEFEDGKLKLEDLRDFALANGEPKQTSGRQEWLENIVNQYI